MTTQILPPTEDETAFHTRLYDWVSDHATASGHPFDNTPFLLELREDGQCVAGFEGYRLFDWLFVRYIAVAPHRRGRGHGARLVRAAEDKARAEGITGIFIDSYAFQAPEFYEKLGYTVFGTLDGGPPARRRSYLAKALAPGARID
ncbi:GNAT family N-acetyltransferase [Roseisalinus antarcticus]|uniref:Putative acetyltransferase n=1 Tax=Roseisalinus antarcticus TaxID=254357 RepID=A0A1Y5SSY9_9RHOB|nr:GNAT family N-acetyltransferase [Roseisalinus antarcticus]SLN44430.1 putative acetyltransferase [Roseisalinus antarcticus]